MTQATLIIAEAGVNHNGSRDMALALVDAAADAGADVVKFQTFQADKLATAQAAKADYQKRNGDADESQQSMLRRLELSGDDHAALLEHCGQRGIAFLSSPFDTCSLFYLTDSLNLPCIKLGSGELTNGPFLVAAGQTGREVILSTGMATLGEVEWALAALAYGLIFSEAPRSKASLANVLLRPEAWDALRAKVTLLHCTTQYPAPDCAANLQAMDTLRQAFGLKTGYSDHTDGTEIALAAAARGAAVVEKHLTLDRKLPGPDHAASLEPDAFKNMVEGIRRVEAALGDGRKRPQDAELQNREVARKSLVAARDIGAGEAFSSENLTVLRPGNGLSPFDYWDLQGRPAVRAFAAGEIVEL